MSTRRESEELHNGVAKALDEFEAEYLVGSRLTDQVSQETQEFHNAVAEALNKLEEVYGVAREFTSKSGAVIVMEGWNKALAFQTEFSEALFARWRILVALETLLMQDNPAEGGNESVHHGESLHLVACDQVEQGTDPIAKALGTRLVHGRPLLIAMLDSCVRTLCPHTQTVQREAYRPFGDILKSVSSGFWGMRRLSVDEGSPEEYFLTFARCGILPSHWVTFCKAFLWCCKTHSPYAEESDLEDLESPPMESANAAFVSTVVAKPAIQSIKALHDSFRTPVYEVILPRWWNRVSHGGDKKVMSTLGEAFYRQLLTNHPDLLDYFKSADMDSLSVHFAQTLDLVVKNVNQVGKFGSSFRKVVDHLNEIHRRTGIPSWSFPIVGAQLIASLKPSLEEEEKLTKDEAVRATAVELEEAFAASYIELMVMVYHAMVWEEKLISEAKDFFDQVAEELKWSNDKLSRRWLEVVLEIQGTSTYTHTAEEIQTGARLAWRNSAKCIGRIAWNTLLVRDCRHAESAHDIFKEVKEHLRIATCGTNIQSVMSVFKPKAVNEMWGTRFWSSQFVRYAGYKDQESGKVLGDPGNVDFTEYIIKNGFWTPPEKQTRFDVLPLVLKIPGVRNPSVFELPRELVHEVEIEHPDCPAIKAMGLRWAAVPAIANFNMNLGGVDYQCMPFNGWFVSVEVVRNLFERYNIAEEWAKAAGISTETKRIYEQRVYPEIDIAVNYSFQKQGFSMVDMDTVGKSFFVHCKRERDAGRECPAQWSWIGGLTGPTNPTWHHEMRDFYVAPQYEYCAAPWMVTEFPEEYRDVVAHTATSGGVETNEGDGIKTPRVLIAFGSETGTAEAAALNLARLLKLVKPMVMPLNEIAGLSIVKERRITHLLALTSTFGSGEAPSNAAVFASTDIPPGMLSDTKVAVLALGSTLYPDFCKAGVFLDQQLSKAGAKSLITLKRVDDSTGSHGPIAEWNALVSRLILPMNLRTILERRASEISTPVRYELKWLSGPTQPLREVARFQWPEDESCICCENEELFKHGDIDARSTRKITFQLPEGATYVSGDHLAVQPVNSMEMVHRFAACFKDELVAACQGPGGDCRDPVVWQMQQPFEVDCIEDGDTIPARLAFSTPTSLGVALQLDTDFAMKPNFVEELLLMIERELIPKQHDSETGDGISNLHGFVDQNAALCRQLVSVIEGIKKGSGVDAESIDSFIQSFPTVVDFLEVFGPILCTCGVSKLKKDPLLMLSNLLPLVPRLRARYYSISSSNKTDPTKVSISVGVVHAETSEGVMIHGVCSNYLARLNPKKDRAKVVIQHSNFRGPKSITAPMVLVGAGTGLAPMMGFIQDRANDVEAAGDSEETGETHLFFGCRSQKEQIYAETVDGWVSSGVLQHHLAFSREPGVPKKYVQQALGDYGPELTRLLLRDDTHYYICGDAKVGDECYEACIQALRAYGNMSRVTAVSHLKKMRVEDRWQFDLWGVINHFVEARRQIKKEKKHRSATWLKSFA